MHKIEAKISKHIRKVANAIPLKALIGITGHKLVMPLYHTISDEDLPHIKHLYKVRSSKEFEKDLDIFLKYYKPLGLNELIRESHGEIYEAKEPRFFLSFDDGLRNVKDVVTPILKRKGIPATFFLTSNFIDNKILFYRHKVSLIIEQLKTTSVSKTKKNRVAELLSLPEYEINKVVEGLFKVKFFDKRVLNTIGEVLDIDFQKFLDEYQPYLTENEIGAIIRDGFDIGAHSLDHPMFNEMHFVDQYHQVTRSVDELAYLFADKRRAFAFPFTDYEISEKFIDFIFVTGVTEHTFGTAGIKDESFSHHHQRIPMEIENFNALETLKYQYLTYMLKVPFGKNMIERTDEF